MSRRSKCNVLVVSSHGSAFTTRRGARRMVARGLAEQLADGTVRINEHHHGFAREKASSDLRLPPVLVLSDRELLIAEFARIHGAHGPADPFSDLHGVIRFHPDQGRRRGFSRKRETRPSSRFRL